MRQLTTVTRGLVSALILAGCSSGGEEIVEPTGSISLSLNPTSASVQQGGQVQVTGTLTRSGGFTGTVNFTVTGAPANVTATVSNTQTSGTTTTATITIQAAANAALGGPTSITVRGTAAGLTDAVASFQLTITAPPSFSLSLSPTTALSLQQGTQDNSRTVTINRVNYAPNVTLSAEGLPDGVTATFAGNPVAGNTSVMTLVATAGATVTGPTTITIRGSGPDAIQIPGVSAAVVATVTFQLTVTATPSFSLSLSPAGAVSLQQGTQDQSKTVTLTRTNYSSNITLSAEGLPDGVTASFAGNPVGGNSSLMTLIAAAGATVGGPNTITVRGSGPDALQIPGVSAAVVATTTFQLTVTAAPSSNFQVSFAGCTASQKPVRLFVKDGAANWVQVMPIGDVYSFDIIQGTAGITQVRESGTNVSVNVNYLTRSELQAIQPYRFCTPDPARRFVNATIAGAGVADFVQAAIGGWTNFSLGSGPIVMNPFTGERDFVGYLSAAGAIGGSDRMIFIRNHPATSDDLGTIDFGASPAFGAIPGVVTLTGTAGGETMGHSMNYFTRASCDQAVLYTSNPVVGNTFVAYGANSPQPATDFHQVVVSTSQTLGPSVTTFRSLMESFHTMQARTVNLPSHLPAPTVTSLGGPYKRLRAEFMLPADYQTVASFSYFATGQPQRSVIITSSYAVLGGAGSQVLELPDFTGVAGWVNADAPDASRIGGWNVTVNHFTHQGNACNEGARSITAARTGSF